MLRPGWTHLTKTGSVLPIPFLSYVPLLQVPVLRCLLTRHIWFKYVLYVLSITGSVMLLAYFLISKQTTKVASPIFSYLRSWPCSHFYCFCWQHFQCLAIFNDIHSPPPGWISQLWGVQICICWDKHDKLVNAITPVKLQVSLKKWYFCDLCLISVL